MEPGPALRGRMEAILHHDPGLDAPAYGGQVATVHRLPGSLDDTGSPAAAGLGASVLSLSDEIARLRSHVERLSREQQHLMYRFDQLSAPPAAGQ